MKKILVLAMLALLLFTAGCDKTSSDNPAAPPPDKIAPSKPEVKTEIKPEPSKPEPVVENKTTVPNTEGKVQVIEKSPIESMNIKVYYPDDSGMKLVEVEREIEFRDSNDKYIAAVETLLEEPVEDNLTKIFPRNAAIRSVTVEDGLATVDFDGSLTKSFVGGSTGEEFLIGSVVDTLTNFPEVTQVKFLVDGQEIETLSGHMDLSTPLERMSDLTN